MKKPQMIFFDYGQTLGNEKPYDGIAGGNALLPYMENPNGVTAENLIEYTKQFKKELGWYIHGPHEHPPAELHNRHFWRFLFEYLDLKLKIPYEEAERIYWDASSPTVPTKNVGKMLDYLYQKGIRSAVISNMNYSDETLNRRLAAIVPNNHFEFVLNTCEYIFRKPHPRIFELALRKAKVSAENVWHCGDSLDCDVAASGAAGITPVWYKGALRIQEENPHQSLEISDWNELIELLEKCE